ncbi:transporter substrate-binding domain-containing protein [Litorilituus sediminis]|uniref:Transporter substrate-binding domain-containing protein n=2 Tax=Litorilituus sediminis TaxID=718192 RepID=A0A4P6P2R6_9GAMM|nr:transporter substrate-binding domain-containing protein [Litorilituus sediminis]
MYQACYWKLTFYLLICFYPFIVSGHQITCGISDGFPPYQFKDNKMANGFDVQVLKLVEKQLNTKIVIKQQRWSDVVSQLRFTNKLDCIFGMEISKRREQSFLFTRPYYRRKIAIFALENNKQINSLKDLIGENITGDRHSSIEKLLQDEGLIKQIRIKETRSKEESIKLLKTGKFVAMIAPKAVGFHLAKQFDVNVKVISESPESTPVAIAVKKGNASLANQFDKALQTLLDSEQFNTLKYNWLNK